MAIALLDTNVLVHAASKSSPLHAPAAELVDRGMRESGRYCIAPQNLVEFAAVVTRPRLVQTPMPFADLARMVDLLFRSRRLAKIHPKRATVMRAVTLGADLGITGPRWYDIFLAVTMSDAGVRQIVTENITDFQRIPFVSTIRIQDAR